jgi:hypothetical protein
MSILSIKHYLPSMRRSGSVGDGLRISSPTGSEGKHIEAEDTWRTIEVHIAQAIHLLSIRAHHKVANGRLRS